MVKYVSYVMKNSFFSTKALYDYIIKVKIMKGMFESQVN